ncbi:hypothetical protein Hanom_Chr04g00380831 [Helianthus anomalus]
MKPPICSLKIPVSCSIYIFVCCYVSTNLHSENRLSVSNLYYYRIHIHHKT